MDMPYVDYKDFEEKIFKPEIDFMDVKAFELDSDFANIKKFLSNNHPKPSITKTIRSIKSKSKSDDGTSTTQSKTLSESEQKDLKTNIDNYIDSKDISDDFKNYLKKMSERESSYNPYAVNRFGYKGLYQFGDSALQDIGMTEEEYMSDWRNQVDAMIKYTSKQYDTLKPYIDLVNGTEEDGIKLTTWGILAGAHLVGAGTTKKVLDRREKDAVDGNNVSIKDYWRMFQ